MKIEFEIKGLDKLDKKLNDFCKRLPETIKESIEEISKNIQGYAIRLEKGKNSEGILCEMVNMSNKEVVSRVYADTSKFMSDNNQSYLWFEYFGTGQWAEQEHIGKTKHFIESGYTEWYIPVNKVEKGLNYPIVTINNQQFYVAIGSKGNHFLEDAEFKSRNENVEIIKKKLDEMLKEICK